MKIDPKTSRSVLALALFLAVVEAIVLREEPGENVVAGVVENNQVPSAVAVGARQISAQREAAERASISQLPLDELGHRRLGRALADVFAVQNWELPARPTKIKVVAARPPDPPIVVAPPPPPSTPAVAPAPPPAPPLLPFTYMGQFEPEAGRFIVYLVKGDHAYSVRPGDVIDKTYKVEKVERDKVVFTYLPLDAQQILPIGGGS